MNKMDLCCNFFLFNAVFLIIWDFTSIGQFINTGNICGKTDDVISLDKSENVFENCITSPSTLQLAEYKGNGQWLCKKS